MYNGCDTCTLLYHDYIHVEMEVDNNQINVVRESLNHYYYTIYHIKNICYEKLFKEY